MNTGTQAAKEAGNMVDLDSDPTKLIAVVEIGKQLLVTRGALTTFSIANDVAKYFAIIPAMFVGVLPQLDQLNVMDLQSPRSAILAAELATGTRKNTSIHGIAQWQRFKDSPDPVVAEQWVTRYRLEWRTKF